MNIPVTLDMLKKSEKVKIVVDAFDNEVAAVTLDIKLSNYDLTGKTITALFSATNAETGTIMPSPEGVISVALYPNLVNEGINLCQLLFRDVDSTERSPIVWFSLSQGLDEGYISPEYEDIIDELVTKMNSVATINDITPATTSVYSSSKTVEELNKKSNTDHSHVGLHVHPTNGAGDKYLSDNGTYNSPIDDITSGTTKTYSSAKILEQIAAKIAELVNAAPGTLDTLNEVAAALGNDPNFATTIVALIGTKVDKVNGKDLSANDYTDAEQAKVGAIVTNGAGDRFMADDGSYKIVQTDVIDDTTESLTKTYSSTKILAEIAARLASLVDTAPATLDTLNELAAALGDDPNFATTITTALGNKVDKVAGKALSDYNYDVTAKGKVDKVIIDGTGDTYLSSDGTYKVPAANTDIIDDVTSSTTKTYSSTKILTEITNRIAALVNSAPGTLDTLNELATALGNDPNFATTITTALGNKVDKVAGKGLSTNDYSNADMSKVSKIVTNGDGSQFLSNDGTYKAAPGGTGSGANIDDTTASTSTTYSSSKIESEIQTLGSPIYVDPMNVKDEYIVEYGEFGITSDISGYLANTPITFDKVIIGNMTLSNGGFLLKTNKTYEIGAWYYLVTPSPAAHAVSLYNKLTSSKVMTLSNAVDPTLTSNRATNGFSRIYTPTVDTYFSISIETDVTTISVNNLAVIIREIVQPVVTEYNKEISNPLLANVSQEFAVGSIIQHNGSTPPTNYLECDGSVVNIATYPELAQFFIDTYGKSNCYGGDGITTFGLPLFERKLRNLIPIMTSNTSPYGIATSSSTYGDATNSGAYSVFDKNLLGGWMNDGSSLPCWIGYEFTAPVAISSYLIKLRSADGNDVPMAPKNWTFQAWNGSTWITLDTRTDTSWLYSGQERLFLVPNGTAYTKYRLNITSGNGFGNIITFASLQMFGAVNASITCIRYRPSTLAVSQYGGFESKVLFEGRANAIGNYNLSDSILNYDIIYVFGRVENGGEAYYECSTVLFPAYDLETRHTAHYALVFVTNSDSATRSDLCYGFNFNTSNVLNIAFRVTNGSPYTDFYINKIIGIKGQLPTLLTGGEF